MAIPNALLAYCMGRIVVPSPSDMDLADNAFSVWAGFTSVLFFVLSFRSNVAYNRWWEGGTLLQQTRGEWFNAYSSLIAFTSPDAVREAEVEAYQHMLARLMSLLFCSALQQVSPNRDRTFDILDSTGIDLGSLRFLNESNDRVEVIIQWIQRSTILNMLSGVLPIAPPVMSRVFQEMSRGIVNLQNARKIADFPFPFPYAQTSIVMLIIHWFMCPLLATTLLSRNWATFTCFVVVFFMWCLNFIALQLESPFGAEDNDLPMDQMQADWNNSVASLLVRRANQPPQFKFDPLTHRQMSTVCCGYADTTDMEKRKSLNLDLVNGNHDNSNGDGGDAPGIASITLGRSISFQSFAGRTLSGETSCDAFDSANAEGASFFSPSSVVAAAAAEAPVENPEGSARRLSARLMGRTSLLSSGSPGAGTGGAPEAALVAEAAASEPTTSPGGIPRARDTRKSAGREQAEAVAVAAAAGGEKHRMRSATESSGELVTPESPASEGSVAEALRIGGGRESSRDLGRRARQGYGKGADDSFNGGGVGVDGSPGDLNGLATGTAVSSTAGSLRGGGGGADRAGGSEEPAWRRAECSTSGSGGGGVATAAALGVEDIDLNCKRSTGEHGADPPAADHASRAGPGPGCGAALAAALSFLPAAGGSGSAPMGSSSSSGAGGDPSPVARACGRSSRQGLPSAKAAGAAPGSSAGSAASTPSQLATSPAHQH